MRRMYVKLAALAFVLFGMAVSTTTLKGQILINLTNQVWRYEDTGADPGAFQDPLFDDSAWPEGRSILGFEDSVNTVAVSNNILPYTNTILLAPVAGGPVAVHFRTHFNFGGDPNTAVLTVSNLIDDGYIMWLNGVEVSVFNMNAARTFAAAANPLGEGIYVVSNLCYPAGTLKSGDNVLAVAVYQNATNSSDVVWGTVLHSSAGSRPSITSPTAPVTIPLKQGTSTNLAVAVTAAPCATYQWYFDPTGPNPAAPIAGANGTTYTVANMDPSKAGAYYLQAVNSVGSSNSPAFNVSFDQDLTPPQLIGATASATDLTLITATFSEDVIDVSQSPFDPLVFYIEEIGNPNNFIGVAGAGYGGPSGSLSNIAVLTLNSPRDPAVRYQLVISQHAIQDRFGNLLPDPSIARITEPVVIQEGLNGYASTIDTEVRFSAPDSAAGGALAIVNSDLQDGTPAGAVHSLLRFDNLIGGGPNQVPLGAIITSAELQIYTDDPTDAATPIRLIRMLVPWDEASTWNGLGSGIDQTNNVECSATVDAIIDGSQDNTFDTMNVTATIQAWANGTVNYGWVFLPSGNNGWRWATSENGTAANRPRLTVAYTIQTAPCHIESNPTNVTVAEKSPFALSVVSRGSDLTYQWYFDPTGAPVSFSPVAGATGPSYSVARAVPANAGSYYVVVANTAGAPCTSATAVVTVNADLVGPALTSALGNPDQRTISLTFNDTLDATTANNTATYSLNGGLTISGVAVSGSSVTLTSSAPRVVGQSYTLTITGLRDDAASRNLIVPNPTTTNLPQQILILPFGSVWKFETNGLDLGTAWSQPGYNDSAWPSGTALLGHEDTATTFTALEALGLNTNNMTLWERTRPDGTTNVTYYLRKTVNIPFGTGAATLEIRHVTDDGALYHLNGAEVFRYNMPTGAVTYLTFASTAPGEGVIHSSGPLTNFPCGDITVGVEVHQQSLTSSDVLFDGELLVTTSSFGPCTGASRLSIVNNGNGTVTLSWTGSGTLQQSSDLTNWVPAANQNNPQTFAPVGVRFYKVQ